MSAAFMSSVMPVSFSFCFCSALRGAFEGVADGAVGVDADADDDDAVGGGNGGPAGCVARVT